jgi:hypothetical protein
MGNCIYFQRLLNHIFGDYHVLLLVMASCRPATGLLSGRYMVYLGERLFGRIAGQPLPNHITALAAVSLRSVFPKSACVFLPPFWELVRPS